MSRYIVKRLIMTIPVLIGITIIDYVIMTMAGNPLEMLAGPRVSQAAVEYRAIQLGLDQPVIIQYFVWLNQLIHGNLGYSISTYQSVASMIISHIGPTLLLMVSSLLLSYIIALPAGIYSAIKQYSKGDYMIVTTSFVASSIPSFFLALLLVYVFSIQLGWLPSNGMVTLGQSFSLIDLLQHMVLPTVVLALSFAGSNIRYIRSAMLEILQNDYLRVAKAKGIGIRKVIWKHGLKNAMIPILSLIGTQIPMLFGGAVIVEQVFSWPGLGLMTMSAIISRDYPVIMGVCLLSAIVVLIGNLVIDILYAIVDKTIELR